MPIDLTKIPPVAKGYQRQWLRCRICRSEQYYDFIPYSLSNPILVGVCNHDVRRDMDYIDESELTK